MGVAYDAGDAEAPNPVKRIIIVVAAYFPDSFGGAERQAEILAEALGRQGVDVTLVAPTVAEGVAMTEATAFGRIERYRVSSYPSNGGRHLLSFLSWTFWFRGKFGAAEYAGVPIYVFHARLHALGATLAARAGNAPLMIKLGGGGEASDFAALRAKRYFYGHWVQSMVLGRTDVFVANSSQIVTDLRELGVDDDRIANFPNGVVLPPEDDVMAALDARRGRRFIFTGRLLPDKRVDVIYQAAARLLSEQEDLEMLFLGEGSEGSRLAALPETDAFSGRIAFPGFVKDVYPSLMEADFFVSASMREGQSNSLLEAMSVGVIPIVFAASGVRDVVDHGRTGFVIERSDAESFAAAMRAAIRMPAERRRAMALAARGFAEDSIGIDAIAARTLEAVGRAADSRRARA